uniref:G2/mitotic-specific cyclin-B3 n=2 Tax=Panagrellus redivivus TaxID=6233 RepID=A0A7E4ZYU3_PANRE
MDSDKELIVITAGRKVRRTARKTARYTKAIFGELAGCLAPTDPTVPRMEGITKRFCINVNNKANIHAQPPAPEVFAYEGEPMDVDVPNVISTALVWRATAFDARIPPVDLDMHDSAVKYLMARERTRAVKPDFLNGTGLNNRMRQILVDWLFQLELRCGTSHHTLQLGVAMLDYCLSNIQVDRIQLQLLGATCLFMASKFEEVYPPGLNDIVYLSAQSFTKKDVIRMELIVFKCLNYDINLTTPCNFLDPYKIFFKPSELVCHYAELIVDLTLVNYDVCQVLPSLRAQGALYLAYRLAGEPIPSKMYALFGATEKELQEVALRFRPLIELFSQTSKECTVHRKFKQAKYRNFTSRVPMEVVEAAYQF